MGKLSLSLDYTLSSRKLGIVRCLCADRACRWSTSARPTTCWWRAVVTASLEDGTHAATVQSWYFVDTRRLLLFSASMKSRWEHEPALICDGSTVYTGYRLGVCFCWFMTNLLINFD